MPDNVKSRFESMKDRKGDRSRNEQEGTPTGEEEGAPRKRAVTRAALKRLAGTRTAHQRLLWALTLERDRILHRPAPDTSTARLDALRGRLSPTRGSRDWSEARAELAILDRLIGGATAGRAGRAEAADPEARSRAVRMQLDSAAASRLASAARALSLPLATLIRLSLARWLLQGGALIIWPRAEPPGTGPVRDISLAPLAAQAITYRARFGPRHRDGDPPSAGLAPAAVIRVAALAALPIWEQLARDWAQPGRADIARRMLGELEE